MISEKKFLRPYHELSLSAKWHRRKAVVYHSLGLNAKGREYRRGLNNVPERRELLANIECVAIAASNAITFIDDDSKKKCVELGRQLAALKKILCARGGKKGRVSPDAP